MGAKKPWKSGQNGDFERTLKQNKGHSTVEWWSNLEFRIRVLKKSGLFFMIGSVVEHTESGIPDPWSP